MFTNYFFLSAGLIGLFFAVGHATWVQKHVVRDVEASEMPNSTKRSIFAFLHYTTSTMFWSAVALITVSMFSNMSTARPLAWFVVAINAGNLLVAVGTILTRERAALLQTVPQVLVMIVWIGIIVAGI